MKNFTKILSMLLAIVLCVALFAGCGAKEDEEANTPAPAITVNPDDDGGVAIENVPEVTETTVYADELIYCAGDFSTPSPLNPAFVASQITIIMPMLYDSLLDRLPEGGYGPRLAKTWDTEDYQTWHLTLRDDVDFHNGEHFTAQSIADCIEVAMNAPGAISASKWMEVDHVEILGDYECNIVLKRVLIDFDNYMADPMTGMMSKKAVEADPDLGMMVGTGSWVFKEAISGSHITLLRNDNYWGEPALAKVFTMKVVTESTARDIMFQNGELDFAGANKDLMADYEAAGIVVDQYVMSNTSYLCFNLNDPLMADINFRKAVLYTMDRQEIVDVYFQGNAHTWDTNSYWGSRTNYKLEIPVIPQDFDKAKEFLAQSAYAGEHIMIWAAMPQTIGFATVIAENMLKAGIDCEVFQTDNANMGASTLWGSTAYQMLVNSGPWSSLGSSCNLFFKAGAMANKAQWNDPRIQELIGKADTTPNGPEREAIYKEIQQICSDEIPYIGLNNMQMLMGRQGNCGGMLYFTDNYHDYSHAFKIVEE